MEIFVPYLIYSIAVGIGLAIYYAVKSDDGIPSKILGWLVLLPAVGLGKWHYYHLLKSGERTDYPEKWYILKYMIKVHRWYLILQLVIPATLLLLLFSGLALDGLVGSGGDLVDLGLGFLLGLGVIAILLMVFFFSFIWLGIQYLLLVAWPKSEQRKIERDIYRAAREGMATLKPPVVERKPISLLRNIQINVLDYLPEFKNIPSSRKKELETVSAYIKQKIANGEAVNLTFICTHNSRRSQLGQIWAAVAAAFYGVKNVQAFSGGTEETAFNKRAVDAIKRVGFIVDGTVGTNPRYSVRFSDEAGALDCFSKKFDHSANPQKGFAAIMTCSDADENCPIVLGAEFRARITYEDPKIADRTEQETATYDQRSKQIATEMLYLFSKI